MLNINKWLKTHASEFINNDNLNINELENLMIHFAREHVEAALKEASQNVEIKTKYKTLHGEKHNGLYCNKDSILNAYPLENIK